MKYRPCVLFKNLSSNESVLCNRNKKLRMLTLLKFNPHRDGHISKADRDPAFLLIFYVRY